MRNAVITRPYLFLKPQHAPRGRVVWYRNRSLPGFEKPVRLLKMRDKFVGETREGVEYTNEQSCKEYQLSVRNGLIYDSKGEPFDTNDSILLDEDGEQRSWPWAIFVLDRKERWLADTKKITNAWHHSSLSAGRELIFSGAMVATHGKLQQVWDWSGHYHPDIHAFLGFVNYLKRTGIDPRTVHFIIHRTSAISAIENPTLLAKLAAVAPETIIRAIRALYTFAPISFCDQFEEIITDVISENYQRTGRPLLFQKMQSEMATDHHHQFIGQIYIKLLERHPELMNSESLNVIQRLNRPLPEEFSKLVDEFMLKRKQASEINIQKHSEPQAPPKTQNLWQRLLSFLQQRF